MSKLTISLCVLYVFAGLISVCEAQEKNLESEIIEVKKRVKFSEGFLKEFPHIYQDLATRNTPSKFKLLLKVISLIPRNQRWDTSVTLPIKDHYVYKDKVTTDDMTGLIGEILRGGLKALTLEQKAVIMAVCWGGNFCYRNNIMCGWYEPIPQTIPFIIRLQESLELEHYDDKYAREKARNMCRLANFELNNLGAKATTLQLVRLLENEDWMVCRWAIFTLNRRGKLSAKYTLRGVVTELDDEVGVRAFATKILGELSANMQALIEEEKEEERRKREAERLRAKQEEELKKKREQELKKLERIRRNPELTAHHFVKNLVKDGTILSSTYIGTCRGLIPSRQDHIEKTMGFFYEYSFTYVSRGGMHMTRNHMVNVRKREDGTYYVVTYYPVR